MLRIKGGIVSRRGTKTTFLSKIWSYGLINGLSADTAL